MELNNSCRSGEKAVIFYAYMKTLQDDIMNLLFQTKDLFFSNQKKEKNNKKKPTPK